MTTTMFHDHHEQVAQPGYAGSRPCPSEVLLNSSGWVSHMDPDWSPTSSGMPGAAAPRGKRRVGLMIGLVGGGVTAMLAAIVILVVIVTQPAAHAVGTPATAAGLNRDTASERMINIDALKRNLAEHANGQVRTVVSAVYANGVGAGASTRVLFIGGEASSVDPDSFIADFTASAQNTQRVDTGSFDGDAACGELSAGIGTRAISCVWADNDTFGPFVFLSDGQAVSDLAALMQRMRPSLETEK